jgi:hypothetical protein
MVCQLSGLALAASPWAMPPTAAQVRDPYTAPTAARGGRSQTTTIAQGRLRGVVIDAALHLVDR